MLLELDHSSSYLSNLVLFIAAVICAVSSSFMNFAFPSHTSPAYSNFGIIALIVTHILILVSWRESVLIGSHPCCLRLLYPFLLLLPCVHPKSSLLRYLCQVAYTDLRSVTVSYTHLRAHETRHDLVCRLLLEKKKT